ncbi:uncharacterized protein LOC115808967 [Chanos chanos]|uniref:Uncharacterized protein LOC115808967 n=1 Tax=Chanos chanos TaxID=29144 RepID=A0A6J2V4T7_CHACN|nr:uncharacterized protein LOC115808967 [Chanos chanos]
MPSTCHSPHRQHSASENKDNLSTQMQRFLSILNKGVDSKLMASLVQEARKGLTDIEGQENLQLRSGTDVSRKDELYDRFKETGDGSKQSVLGRAKSPFEDYSQDYLLPHEKAVQDGSGFSRIVGMKHGIYAQEDVFREPNTEDEERFLYGEKMSVDDHSGVVKGQSRFIEKRDGYAEDRDWYMEDRGQDSHLQRQEGDRYADEQDRGHHVEGWDQHPKVQVQYLDTRYEMDPNRSVGDHNECVENRDEYHRMTVADRYKEVHSPVHQIREEPTEKSDDKIMHFDKIQSLLQTIGLNLDTAEVSKLADRTRERLYGKKAKVPGSCSDSSGRKSERSLNHYDRHRSRTDSSESEGFRSVSPAKSSRREVYMSYRDSLKFSDQCNKEGEIVKDLDLHRITRTIRNSPESTQHTQDHHPSHTAEATFSDSQSSSSQYAQGSSESAYLATQYPYGENRDYATLALTQGLNSAYTSHSIQHFSVVHGGMGTPAHLPPSYNPYIMQSSHAPMLSSMPCPPQVPFQPPFFSPPPYGPTDASAQSVPPSLGYHENIPMQRADSASSTMKKTSNTKSRCLRVIETVKTERTVSVESSSPSQGEGTPVQTELKQVAPITEDDIKAKQKRRLEQFNQRMRQKKEQQMEAQRTRGQTPNTTPGKVLSKEVKNVWICGHSLVFWAEKRDKSPEFGMQLGMDPKCVRVWWKGVQGMTWQQLLPQLLQLKGNWPNPDVILMHLGGNDIGKSSPEAFVSTVKKDLLSMKSIFPDCLLVWSDILPRRSWRHTDDSLTVDNIRMAINESIQGIIKEIGGTALTHENIRPGSNAGLYRPDGVHLSGKGIDTFNSNIQDFLEKWEAVTNQTETETDQATS